MGMNIKTSALLFAAVATAPLMTSPALAQAGTSANAAASTQDYNPPMDFPGWGFNMADLDPSVKPGDDFFAYVNGKWLAREVIPPQYP
jgi:putative endopeptidase